MEDQIKKLEKEIDKLKDDIKLLTERRISQTMVMQGAIKNKHLGEPNTYIRSGLAADRPTGADVTFGTTAYFATDTFVLSIWTGTAYKTVTLT